MVKHWLGVHNLFTRETLGLFGSRVHINKWVQICLVIRLPSLLSSTYVFECEPKLKGLNLKCGAKR